ncbi:hypothetical protein H2200_000147 [Cladophialophora chaetospira]|uniref:DUF2278 family protein n=1 Tax=Cladophialophora chaetospira TaxID=386627 RepID=A0AA38XMZ9_9EURO|nr:hypothetical protein H2200_000147 [Cladophialophora chaetospira]
MPIRNYGVWKGKPLSYTVDGPDDHSPHINLVFGDKENSQLKAAINVKSQANPSELVYWFDGNFQNDLTQLLQDLDAGFHSLAGSDEQGRAAALDYYRTRDLLVVTDGRLLPFDEDGSNNDILDQLIPVLDEAIGDENGSKADIYLFGQKFITGDGIHDIHMNQGSPGHFSRDNGVNTDGGIIFKFPDGHWHAIFLAFASQHFPTDSSGQPAQGSRPLWRVLGGANRPRL